MEEETVSQTTPPACGEQGGTVHGEPSRTTPPNKGGAPYGNQNARKHGFYSANLNETERAALEVAAEMRGIDDEIAILRVKIQSLVRSDHGNIRLAIQATSTLARLLKIRDEVSGGDDDYDLSVMDLYKETLGHDLGPEEAARFLEHGLFESRQPNQESADAP